MCHARTRVAREYALTIDLTTQMGVIPEVSANKYFTHIRFLMANQDTMRGKVSERDIEFTLKMCSFDAEWK